MPILLRPRQSLTKEKFSVYFSPLKGQAYADTPSSRGAGYGLPRSLELPLRAGFRPMLMSSEPSLRSIAWNPLGSLIATAAVDKTVRVWNPEKPNVRFSTELKGHSAPIEKVAFNPVKDAELCSVSSDGVVKFWDVRTKGCVNEIKGLGDAFTLAWAPDGESLIVGNKSDNIFILSPTQATPLANYQQNVQTNQIAFCWGGQKIFVANGEGRIRILSYPDLKPVLRVNYTPGPGESDEFVLTGHTSSCVSVDLQPTGRYLATGGSDSIIALWDTADWICRRTLTSMVGPVRSISFTFDGNYVVGGSDEGSGLEVCHTESGEVVHSFKTAGPCPVVSWAPTRYCLAYSDIGTLKIVGVDSERK